MATTIMNNNAPKRDKEANEAEVAKQTVQDGITEATGTTQADQAPYDVLTDAQASEDASADTEIQA